MPLLHDDLFEFSGYGGTPSRCHLRVFLPPEDAREAGYIVLLTDDASAFGTSITNAAEQIAALVCAQYHIPQDRVTWIEHYEFRHTEAGHDGSGHEQTFARVRFSVPEEAHAKAAYVHGTSLGKPAWTHIDRQSVEMLIGQPIPDFPETARAAEKLNFFRHSRTDLERERLERELGEIDEGEQPE